MTVKELIIKLLDEDMNATVQLSIDVPHQSEHGDCEGYVFDIDSVSHEFGECLIKFTDWRKAKPILDETIDGPGKDGNIKESKTEYKAKVKELELAITLCKQAEKEFKSRTCKFKSPTNCDFCAFHSDCDEHWKEGDEE